jgi:selenocysteine-specific elongation factor
MRVIGTAGHVDHGKSTLVEALTGTHPDRLKEEREREMTIDLGFAWLSLPDGEEVGIVDVPGHRDFIENMLAGVGGIDAALFVIAADEGVMPQTREHLAILDLLQIKGGVVALNKVDLIDDDDWLDLIEGDIRQTLAGTILSDAPIVRVSARMRTGLDGLIRELRLCLESRPPRMDLGKPRLPIDRVFTIAGFGTVVTGTLSDGTLHIGDEVEILPKGLKGRIRGLQTHKRKEEVAVPGSRTAINLSGITVEQIRRGDVITHPHTFQPTSRLDVRFRLLPDASHPLRHNSQVKFFIGASEIMARLRLLGRDEIQPGEEGWLQVELTEPVIAVRGDRYVLRRPSPGETIGGGFVVDPHPVRRYKRFSTDTMKRLEALAQGTPAEILLQSLTSLGAAPLKEVISRSSLGESDIDQAIQELVSNRHLFLIERGTESLRSGQDRLVASKSYWEHICSLALAEVGGYHKVNPLRRGMPREELRSRLKASPRLFSALVSNLLAENRLLESGPLVFVPGFEVRFNVAQQKMIDRLLERITDSGYAPPSVKECKAEVGEDLYNALVELGRLVQVSADVVFSRETYDRMVTDILAELKEKKTLSAAEVRDHFGTSRRYVLALLEHLDAEGLTLREGDVRRLKA